MEGSEHGLLSRHLPGQTEENHKKLVRLMGVPAEIRTRHLSNASQMR
jgi:hypothetical protein